MKNYKFTNFLLSYYGAKDDLSGFIADLLLLMSYPENSQVANARFQAAAAIRDAAIREWSFLTADVKRTLIRLFLLL